MKNFLIIFEIEKFNVKNNKSVSSDDEIKYFIHIVSCEIIIVIKECEILKRTMLALISFKVFIVLMIFSESDIVFS